MDVGDVAHAGSRRLTRTLDARCRWDVQPPMLVFGQSVAPAIGPNVQGSRAAPLQGVVRKRRWWRSISERTRIRSRRACPSRWAMSERDGRPRRFRVRLSWDWEVVGKEGRMSKMIACRQPYVRARCHFPSDAGKQPQNVASRGQKANEWKFT